MKTLEIIYDSILFPFRLIKYFLLIGFLILLTLLITISPIVITNAYYEINILSFIFLLFSTIIIFGFFIRIVHNTIHNKKITKFKWLFNIYEGIKFVLLLFYYFIIPIVILAIILFITDSLNPTGSINHALSIGNTTTDILFSFIN